LNTVPPSKAPKTPAGSGREHKRHPHSSTRPQFHIASPQSSKAKRRRTLSRCYKKRPFHAINAGPACTGYVPARSPYPRSCRSSGVGRRQLPRLSCAATGRNSGQPSHTIEPPETDYPTDTRIDPESTTDFIVAETLLAWSLQRTLFTSRKKATEA